MGIGGLTIVGVRGSATAITPVPRALAVDGLQHLHDVKPERLLPDPANGNPTVSCPSPDRVWLDSEPFRNLAGPEESIYIRLGMRVSHAFHERTRGACARMRLDVAWTRLGFSQESAPPSGCRFFGSISAE